MIDVREATAVAACVAATISGVLGRAVPASAQAGSLTVQLVERGWLPVPTTDVEFMPVTNCTPSGRPTAPATSKTTDKAGNATFTVAGKGHYRMRVKKQGGFAAKQTCVELFDFEPSFPTAYVQIRLDFAGGSVVVK